MRRVDMICSTWIKSLVSVSFARRSLFAKIVLHRIISIVRFLTVQCNWDRSINRDDDTKRFPLSARHVTGFVYVTSSRRLLMTVPFFPITGEMDEVIAFWAVSHIDWSRIWIVYKNTENATAVWCWTSPLRNLLDSSFLLNIHSSPDEFKQWVI